MIPKRIFFVKELIQLLKSSSKFMINFLVLSISCVVLQLSSERFAFPYKLLLLVFFQNYLQSFLRHSTHLRQAKSIFESVLQLWLLRQRHFFYIHIWWLCQNFSSVFSICICWLYLIWTNLRKIFYLIQFQFILLR